MKLGFERWTVCLQDLGARQISRARARRRSGSRMSATRRARRRQPRLPAAYTCGERDVAATAPRPGASAMDPRRPSSPRRPTPRTRGTRPSRQRIIKRRPRAPSYSSSPSSRRTITVTR